MRSHLTTESSLQWCTWRLGSVSCLVRPEKSVTVVSLMNPGNCRPTYCTLFRSEFIIIGAISGVCDIFKWYNTYKANHFSPKSVAHVALSVTLQEMTSFSITWQVNYLPTPTDLSCDTRVSHIRTSGLKEMMLNKWHIISCLCALFYTFLPAATTLFSPLLFSSWSAMTSPSSPSCADLCM